MSKGKVYTFEMLAPIPSQTIKIHAYSLESAEKIAEDYYKGELRAAANNCCAHLIEEHDRPEE